MKQYVGILQFSVSAVVSRHKGFLYVSGWEWVAHQVLLVVSLDRLSCSQLKDSLVYEPRSCCCQAILLVQVPFRIQYFRKC